MAKEIERKFFVGNDIWRQQVTESHNFVQGYFNRADGYCLRIRISDDKDAFLTIKSSRMGISRSEFEYVIPLADARSMLAEFCSRRMLAKCRHLVICHGQRWEIDEYSGLNQGLVIAELELPSEDAPYERPEWLGDEIVCDIRYSNQYLTEHPFSQWGKA